MTLTVSAVHPLWLPPASGAGVHMVATVLRAAVVRDFVFGNTARPCQRSDNTLSALLMDHAYTPSGGPAKILLAGLPPGRSCPI